MPDYMPITGHNPAVFTLTAGAAIIGGQLVEMSANDSVIPAAGTNRPIAVALFDAPVGTRVSLAPIASVIIHESTVFTAAVLAAGVPVVAAAAGTVNTAGLAASSAAGTLLGLVVRGATGPAKCRWIGV